MSPTPGRPCRASGAALHPLTRSTAFLRLVSVSVSSTKLSQRPRQSAGSPAGVPGEPEGPRCHRGGPRGPRGDRRAARREGGPTDSADVPSHARLVQTLHGACVPHALGQLCPKAPTSLPQSWREMPSTPSGSWPLWVTAAGPSSTRLCTPHLLASVPWLLCFRTLGALLRLAGVPLPSEATRLF